MAGGGKDKERKGEKKDFVSKDLTEDELKYIYRNKKGKVIFTPVYQIYNKTFFNEIVKNTSIETDFTKFRDTAIYERYMLNAAQFSAAKSAAEAKLLQDAIFDSDKKIRTYPEFKKVATDIAEVSNTTWLRVEYDMCRRQAVQGERFRTMESEADLYPYWVYHGVMDDREREEHVELEGLVFKIGDPDGDAIFPPVDWNCRCSGYQVDDEYVDKNNIKVQTPMEAASLLESNVDEQFRYNPASQGMMPNTGNYFEALEDANDADYQDFDLPSAKNNPSQLDEEIEALTPAERKVYEKFERDDTLTADDATLQEKSILKVVKHKDELVDDFIKENKNVVNTDDARRLFTDIGYKGSNAAAVHEASSVVAKDAYKKLVAEGKNKHVSFYAGGSGSGKTSSIDKIFTGLKDRSDAIVDGNLSNYAKAVKQIYDLLDGGRDIDIIYCYRPPTEAWDGVIHRMLHNKKEMGRLVPLSTFLKNTEGSYNTIKGMYEAGVDKWKGVQLNIIDNSFGPGKAEMMDRKKFDHMTFPKDLENRCKAITQDYFDRGEITEEQYNQLNL